VRSVVLRLVALGLTSALLVGCTSEASSTTKPPSTRSSASASPAASVSAIVGRWQQKHTCSQLVAALEANGLGSVAPAIVGDFFPDRTPQQLAKKGDRLCDGAKPQEHAHFFTAEGAFGSLDQFEQQVDDGPYKIVSDHVMTIGDARFGYVVEDGVLMLKPLISREDRRAARASPYDFSTAGWQVAVTYGGRPWHLVPCEGWC
jgi:hypothetical protein